MRYFIKRKNRTGLNTRLCGRIMITIMIGVSSLSVYANKSVDNTTLADTLTVRDIFKKIQNPSLEILPISTRLDMLDYWDVDSIYKAINALGGISYLESLSDNYMKVKISKVSSLEIKILPMKKGRLILTVYTIGDSPQAKDSELKFYDEALNELPADKHFVMPAVKDFFEIPKGSKTSMKELEQMIPFPTIEYSANAETNNLKAKLTVEAYMDVDDWNIAKIFLKPDIILEWNKDKFKYSKH